MSARKDAGALGRRRGPCVLATGLQTADWALGAGEGRGRGAGGVLEGGGDSDGDGGSDGGGGGCGCGRAGRRLAAGGASDGSVAVGL